MNFCRSSPRLSRIGAATHLLVVAEERREKMISLYHGTAKSSELLGVTLVSHVSSLPLAWQRKSLLGHYQIELNIIR
jgi:hypothetical protein